MDAIAVSVSIAAIISSVSSLTLNTLEILRRAKKSTSELESQFEEIQVVALVLQECYEIVQSSENTQIPPSVQQTMLICKRRYVDKTGTTT